MARLGALRVAAGVALGAALGVGSYTLVYARAGSYLLNDPETCINCHVMQGNYDSWTRSSHHAVAVCNDCHTPHDLIGKYYVKSRNGWNHSKAFTLQNFHEPIQITEFNRKVALEACRSCHEDFVEMVDQPAGTREGLDCIRCHPSVGHMELE